jgi:multidrug efflux pump subunit AcrA (membrane-fusion protein)
MKPPADMEVLPGMTVTVRATVPRHDPIENWSEGLTLVPAGALVNAPSGESYVWIIGDEPGTPRKVIVTVGEPREGGIEIHSGLEPGQRIATAGVHSIDESTPVRPMHEGGEGLDG